MNWQSLGKKIAAAGFPSIGASLGGPVGAAVGEQIAKALGAEPTPDSIAKTILHDDTSLIALRTIEADLEKERLEAETRRAEIEVDDRKDARQYRELDVTRKQLALALFVAVPCMAVAVAWLSDEFSPNDMVLGALVALLGTLVRDLSGALAYYFGTSGGSSEKAKTIDRIVK